MAAAPIAKIVLKNTTKLSLNERFTSYRQQGQNAVTNIRLKMQQQRQASLKNRRLAQQMANRPSVIAALKLKRRSLKQRLGQNPGGSASSSSVKSRLSFGRQGNRNVRGRLGGSGQAGRTNRGRGVISLRKGIRWSGDSSGGTRSGTSPMLKGRLGNQNLPNNKNRQGRNRSGYRRGRGFGRNYRQQRGGGNFRGQFRNRNNNSGRAGINSGGRRGGRGGGGGGSGGGRRRQGRGRGRNWGPSPGANKNSISKQELDNQLDEYMAKTKSHLDAELDAYMSQADS